MSTNVWICTISTGWGDSTMDTYIQEFLHSFSTEKQEKLVQGQNHK